MKTGGGGGGGGGEGVRPRPAQRDSGHERKSIQLPPTPEEKEKKTKIVTLTKEKKKVFVSILQILIDESFLGDFFFLRLATLMFNTRKNFQYLRKGGGQGGRYATTGCLPSWS